MIFYNNQVFLHKAMIFSSHDIFLQPYNSFYSPGKRKRPSMNIYWIDEARIYSLALVSSPCRDSSAYISSICFLNALAVWTRLILSLKTC